MNRFDEAVISYIQRKCKTEEDVIRELVSMIAYGNVDYVNSLVADFGLSKRKPDILVLASKILRYELKSKSS